MTNETLLALNYASLDKGLNLSMIQVARTAESGRQSRVVHPAKTILRSGALLTLLSLSIASADAGAVTAAANQVAEPAQSAPVAANSEAKPAARPPKNSVAVQQADPAREAWRTALLGTRRTKEACATATYPDKQWHEVPCATPPARPIVKPGVRPHIVGGPDPDLIFVTANGHITDGEGSFDKVTGVTSVKTNGTSNAFSLQLNTNVFMTPTCGSQRGCQGWVQFVYSSSGRFVFIQYWLKNYAINCPDQWQSDGQGGCFRNGSAISTPNVTIADLHSIKLYGVMGDYLGAPDTDSVTVEIANKLYEASSNSPIADARANWNQIEFNIFGDQEGSRAVFNTPGATIVVRDTMLLGTATSFDCSDSGTTTLESNNLTLSNKTPLVAAVGPPSLVFVESNATGTQAGGCNNAVVIQGHNPFPPIKPIIAHRP